MESCPFDYGPNRHEVRQLQIKSIVPVTLGTTIIFDAHDARFGCKRVTESTWSLWQVREGQRPERMRFGSKAEIEEDVSYVLDIGKLPPRSGEQR